MKIIDDALDQLRAQPEANEEIQELRAQVEAWRKQCDTLTNQVICCGVAARHPDATLTTRGAYAGKWNSPQAEAVRKLRAERDALLATPPTEPQAAQPARVWDEFGRTNAGDETGGSVQRFGFDISGSKPDIIPATNGAFVYYTDYLALHRRLATPPTEPATQANVGLGNSPETISRRESYRRMLFARYREAGTLPKAPAKLPRAAHSGLLWSGGRARHCGVLTLWQAVVRSMQL